MMAGPDTEVLCKALESLGFERKQGDRTPPGGGVKYVITHKALQRLQKAHEEDKTVVVQDSGDVVIE